MTDRKKQGLLIFCSFLVFAALAALFPYTGDDWDWGSRLGLERMATLFADYNGRYLGNFLVIAQTRLRLLNVVVKAACCTLVPVLCVLYSRKGDALTLLFALGLFLLIPRGILSQTVVWTAGFVNYVPSALISGFYLLMLRIAEDRLLEKRKPAFFWGGFLLGFLGALFIENITLFNICLGVAAVLWMVWKHRTVPAAYLGFPAGAVLGAAVMFANSAYRNVAKGEDFYRQAPQELRDIVGYIAESLQKILGDLVLDNWAFCLVLTAVLLSALRSGEKSRSRKIWMGLHIAALALVFIGKPLSDWSMKLDRTQALGLMLSTCIPVAFSVPYLVTVYVLAWFSCDQEKRIFLMLPLLCIPVCMAPLLVVRPIGSRCMFSGYLLLMMFLTGLFEQVRERMCLTEGKKRLTALCMAVFILLQMGHLFAVYYPIHIRDQIMIAYAKAQSDEGSAAIRITNLSEWDYVHCPYPYNEIWWERYCLYYGLNTDTYFELVPQEEFMAEARKAIGR